MGLSPEWLEMMQGKRLLIFDFDGTVADTTPLHAEAFGQVLSPYGISVEYPTISGMKTRDAFLRIAATEGLAWDTCRLDELVAVKQAIVRKLILDRLRPLPGVDRFLHMVRAPFHLAMVTSGSRGTVELSMDVLGYRDWFDPLVTADETCTSKPDPEGYLMALAKTGVPAGHALVFEDSDAGMAAAAAAGISACDVRHRPFHSAFLP